MSSRLSTNHWHTFAAFGAALLTMTTVACASRALPASFPSDAPASAAAAAAPMAPVGVSLAEDPPLPGEPTADWPGLAAPHRGSGGGHAH